MAGLVGSELFSQSVSWNNLSSPFDTGRKERDPWPRGGERTDWEIRRNERGRE